MNYVLNAVAFILKPVCDRTQEHQFDFEYRFSRYGIRIS